MTDKILIENLKEKDEESLGQLIGLYGCYVSAVIYRVSGGYFSKEDVEEMVADVFVALWKNVDGIEAEWGGKPWLGRTARNMAISRFRKEENLLERQAFPLNDEIMIFEKDVTDELAIKREFEKVLNETVGKLKELEREIFVRFYYLNEKILSIAQRLGMNPETVKTKLRRSRKKLQEEFEERGYTYEG